MVALTGPSSTTWVPRVAMKRPSEVPPLVDGVVSVSYTHLDVYKRQVLITLTAGGVLSVALTLAIGWALGADWSVVMSLAPKFVTMPIAMPVAEQIGGVASLAAVMVMLTGVIGTAMGPLLLRWAGVEHPAARGLSYGINAHAIGTAHALQLSLIHI